MPLKSGRSRATVSANIKELIGSGKKLNQALAIAEKKRLQSFKKKKLGSIAEYGMASAKGAVKGGLGKSKLDTSREIDTWSKGGKVYQEMGKGKPRLLGPSTRSYNGIDQTMRPPRTKRVLGKMLKKSSVLQGAVQGAVGGAVGKASSGLGAYGKALRSSGVGSAGRLVQEFSKNLRQPKPYELSQRREIIDGLNKTLREKRQRPTTNKYLRFKKKGKK